MPSSRTEKFYDIPGFEGHYVITRFGVVKSLKLHRGPNKTKSPILKPWLTTTGYLCCTLHINGKPAKKRLHRLLAISFIPNPKKLPLVNHIDGNKVNNLIDNLEWCTPKDNVKHAFEKGLMKPAVGEKASKTKLTKSKVMLIRNEYLSGERKSDLARRYKVSENSIRAILTGKSWKHLPNMVNILRPYFLKNRV